MGPGLDWHRPSNIVGPWWRVCKALGYPELDVRQYADGEYAIIQYHHTPIIPSLTKWSSVLSGIRNVEMTESFIKTHADRLNIEKKAVWAEQEASEKRALEQTLLEERRAQDFSTRMLDMVNRNDAWKERIYRNGLKELEPRRILNHIPKYRLGKGFRENR